LYEIKVEYRYDDKEEDNSLSLIDQIKTLPPVNSVSNHDDTPLYTHKVNKKPKDKKSKKEKKKSKLNSLFILDDDDEPYDDGNGLINVEEFIDGVKNSGSPKNIIKEQKKNYDKLKKNSSDFKKEFAEEITLLYNLLDDTTKFGNALEQDLKSLRGSRVRGVSKYSNDLAELVLTSKQNQLNILKEISSVKKTIADLQIKADAKNKEKSGGETKSPEYLASAYFKNILSHGRNDFIRHIGGDEEDEFDSIVEEIENSKRNGFIVNDTEKDYTDILEARLNEDGNPMRSNAGSKYIEYENRNVNIVIKKNIDTGEWRLAAIDKYNEEIDDYPLPSRRELGKMKFSTDGNYATDEYGRMYNVYEYYEEDDDDEDDED